MNKTTVTPTDKKITVDINGLQSMLSVGKSTAAAIAKSAGAEIHVGRRKLYNVETIERYMNKLTEGAV